MKKPLNNVITHGKPQISSLLQTLKIVLADLFQNSHLFETLIQTGDFGAKLKTKSCD